MINIEGKGDASLGTILINGKADFDMEPRDTAEFLNLEITSSAGASASTVSPASQSSSQSTAGPNTGADKTYYISIRVENKINEPVWLVYAENGHPGEREIPANSVQTAEFITTSASPPEKDVVFKVYSYDRKVQHLINNNQEAIIPPSTERKETSLIITDSQQKVLYINLHVTNNAGKKVTLVWSEDDSPKTEDIENEASRNLTKIIRTSDDRLPEYEFQVHEFGTNRNLLINGQQTFTITPSDDEEAVTYINISPSSGKCI